MNCSWAWPGGSASWGTKRRGAATSSPRACATGVPATTCRASGRPRSRQGASQGACQSMAEKSRPGATAALHPRAEVELGLAKGKAVGWRPGFAAQGDGAAVARQAVEGRAVEAGEGLELVQRTGVVESLGVHLHGGVGGVGAPAGRTGKGRG